MKSQSTRGFIRERNMKTAFSHHRRRQRFRISLERADDHDTEASFKPLRGERSFPTRRRPA